MRGPGYAIPLPNKPRWPYAHVSKFIVLYIDGKSWMTLAWMLLWWVLYGQDFSSIFHTKAIHYESVNYISLYPRWNPDLPPWNRYWLKHRKNRITKYLSTTTKYEPVRFCYITLLHFQYAYGSQNCRRCLQLRVLSSTQICRWMIKTGSLFINTD